MGSHPGFRLHSRAVAVGLEDAVHFDAADVRRDLHFGVDAGGGLSFFGADGGGGTWGGGVFVVLRRQAQAAFAALEFDPVGTFVDAVDFVGAARFRDGAFGEFFIFGGVEGADFDGRARAMTIAVAKNHRSD